MNNELLGFLNNFGSGEIIIIALVVLLLFGGRKISEKVSVPSRME